MAKGYIPLFFDTLEETQDLTDEEFGRLMRAIGAYAIGNEDYAQIITGNEKYAFRFLKGQIDRNTEISNARARAGASGKGQSEAKQSCTEQTVTNISKIEQAEANTEKEKEKEEKKEQNKRFTPPTIDEVRSYCKERNNSVDPERFCDFYASKGWKVGNQPMKDWKAAVRTWEKGRDSPAAKPKTVIAQNYQQRDYEEDMYTSPEDMLRKLNEAVGY